MEKMKPVVLKEDEWAYGYMSGVLALSEISASHNGGDASKKKDGTLTTHSQQGKNCRLRSCR